MSSIRFSKMGDIDDRNMPRSSIASHKKKKKGIPVYASGLAQNGWGVFGAGVVSVVSVNGAAGMADNLAGGVNSAGLADSAGVVMAGGAA